MAEELIPVNLWLAGRSYRIRIKHEEEEAVRKAVKTADEKIMELKNSFAGKDDQDFVAMCLLIYATDRQGTSPFLHEELTRMTERIDKVLGQ
jgi:cell division protein ZapA (FtsZ GTPase activity inhibitor)